MEGQSERHGGGAPEGTGRALRPWPGTGDLGVAPGGGPPSLGIQTQLPKGPQLDQNSSKPGGSANGVTWVSWETGGECAGFWRCHMKC